MTITADMCIREFQQDHSWMERVREFVGLDPMAFAEILACYFRDRIIKESPILLPDWATQLTGMALAARQREVSEQHGWHADMSVLGLIHLELLAREQERCELLYRPFLRLLDGYATGVSESFRILDFGCGMSAFGQLALTQHPRSSCVLADVDPETVRYVQTFFDARWPGRCQACALPITGAPLSKRARVPVDIGTLPGRYDLVILSDVLEHTLDPLDILLRLYRQTQPGGALFVNYPHYIEGDWHTPEAFYLRSWCVGFLRCTCDRLDEYAWKKKSHARAKAAEIALGLLHPWLLAKAQSFARDYFRRHGQDLVATVKASAAREITVEQLIDSVGRIP